MDAITIVLFIINALLVTIMGAIGFIVNGFSDRLKCAEAKSISIEKNYIARFDDVKNDIREVRELIITGFGRIDTKQAVDDEKHSAIGARLDAIQAQLPKRRTK